MDALTAHRLAELESEVATLRADLEPRVRALEIAHARLIGWAAGGAFVGGAAWSVLAWLLKG